MSGSDTNSSFSDRSVYPQSSPTTSLTTASSASSTSQNSLSSITGTTGPSSSVTSCPGTHCSGCPSGQSASSKSKRTSRKEKKTSGKNDSKRERKVRKKVRRGSPAVKRVSFANPLETSDSEHDRSVIEQKRVSPTGSRDPRRIRSTQSRGRTTSSNTAPAPSNNSYPDAAGNENRTYIIASVPTSSKTAKRTRLPYTPPRAPSYENVLRGSSASKSPENSARNGKRRHGSPKQHRPTDSPAAPGPSRNSSSNQSSFVMRSKTIKTARVPMPPADSSRSNTEPAEEVQEDEALPPTGPSLLIRTWNLVEVDMNTRNIRVRLYTLLTTKDADNQEIEKLLRSGQMVGDRKEKGGKEVQTTVQGKMVTREEKRQLGRVEFSVGQGDGFILIERQYEENNETVEAQRREKYEKFCSALLKKDGQEESLRMSISLSHQSNEDRDVISRRDQILIHLGNGPPPDFDTHWELNPESIGDVFMDENVQELQQNSILVTRMIGVHQKNVRDPEYMGRLENWSQWQRNVYLVRYPLNGSSVFLVDDYANQQRVWGHPLADYIPQVTLLQPPLPQQNLVPVALPVRPPTPATRPRSADFLELLADAPMPDDPPFLAPLGPAAINDLMSDFPEEDVETQQHLLDFYGQQNAQNQDQAADYSQPFQDFGAQPQQNAFQQNHEMNYGQGFHGVGAHPQQSTDNQQMNQGNFHIPARSNPYLYRGLFPNGQAPEPVQQQQPQNQQYWQPQPQMQPQQQQHLQQQQHQPVQLQQQYYQALPQQHQQQPQYVTDQNDGTVFVDPSQPGTSGNNDYSGTEGRRGGNSSVNESSRRSTPILKSEKKSRGTKTVSKTMKRKKGSISPRQKKGVKSDVRTRSTQSSNSVSSQRKKKTSGTLIVAKVPGKKESCPLISGIETNPNGHFVINSPWDEPKVLPLDIMNHGPSTVAWSLKTTRPEIFECNYPNGILKAGESMRIFVNFAGFIPGKEPKRSDRLSLMWTGVAEDTVFSRRFFDNDRVTTKKILRIEYNE